MGIDVYTTARLVNIMVDDCSTIDSSEHHWMPFTANRDFKIAPRLQTRSEGVYYWNEHGDKILDGCSGLFNVAAGHNRPEIREAVYRQLGELDYAPHFQLGTPDSFELANRYARVGINRFGKIHNHLSLDDSSWSKCEIN